jgi:hypothetical protein
MSAYDFLRAYVHEPEPDSAPDGVIADDPAVDEAE